VEGALSDVHVFGIKCRAISDEMKARYRDADGEMFQCCDSHCWAAPEFNLTIMAGGEDDGLNVNIPLCERHAQILGDAIEEMGHALEGN
jgi:hypothetical protein